MDPIETKQTARPVSIIERRGDYTYYTYFTKATLKNGSVTYHKHRGVKRSKTRRQTVASITRKKLKITNDIKRHIINEFDTLTIGQLIKLMENTKIYTRGIKLPGGEVVPVVVYS